MNKYRYLLAKLRGYKQVFNAEYITPAMIVFWNPTSKPTIEIAKTLGIIVVAVLFLVYIISKVRKIQSEPLIMALDDAAFIDSILVRSAELQVRFDLICTRPGLAQRHLQGYSRIPINHQDNNKNNDSCRDDDVPNIILDLHAGSVATGWDTAPVDVYFQLTQNDTCTLYHFASFVCKIHKRSHGTIMEIIRPSILSDSKAMDTVRIEPTPEMIGLAYMWFYNTTKTILPQKVLELGRPQAIYRETGNSDFRLISISASGIRVRFLRDMLDDMEHSLEKGHQICLLLSINTSQEKSGRMLIWLKGVCSGFAPCTDHECLDALFSFSHWQQICTRSEEINWYPATDTDRVPPIMHWIMHAEQEREKVSI